MIHFHVISYGFKISLLYPLIVSPIGMLKIDAKNRLSMTDRNFEELQEIVKRIRLVKAKEVQKHKFYLKLVHFLQLRVVFISSATDLAPLSPEAELKRNWQTSAVNTNINKGISHIDEYFTFKSSRN